MQDGEAKALSEHYEEMYELGMETTLAPEMAAVVSNKETFSNFLTTQGFGSYVPKMYANVSMFLADADHAFPVVIKLTKDTTASNGVFVATNMTVLDNLVQTLQGMPTMLQEYIGGTEERIIHISAIRGRLVRMICHYRKLDKLIYKFMDNSNKWRATPFQLPNSECNLPLFSALVKTLKFSGIGNFDTKYTRAGGFKVIEFNPRVPGTVQRDARLFGELACSLLWDGNGILSNNGCVYTTGNKTVI